MSTHRPYSTSASWSVIRRMSAASLNSGRPRDATTRALTSDGRTRPDKMPSDQATGQLIGPPQRRPAAPSDGIRQAADKS
ncbi:hypothetical protein ABT263_20825 [Kitasatospora sp. NPDC001603]|uniref:hypothetical protein n=1 Tax=Kitasatospora sp. NPDC001603 TaxID=3154388 RepID=UPI00331DFA90